MRAWVAILFTAGSLLRQGEADLAPIWYGAGLKASCRVPSSELQFPLDLVHDARTRTILLLRYGAKAYSIRSWSESGAPLSQVTLPATVTIVSDFFRDPSGIRAIAYDSSARLYFLLTLDPRALAIEIAGEGYAGDVDLDANLDRRRAGTIRAMRRLLKWGVPIEGPFNGSPLAQIDIMRVNTGKLNDWFALTTDSALAAHAWDSASQIQIARRDEHAKYEQADLTGIVLARAQQRAHLDSLRGGPLYGLFFDQHTLWIGLRIPSGQSIPWGAVAVRWTGAQPEVVDTRDGLLAREMVEFPVFPSR